MSRTWLLACSMAALVAVLAPHASREARAEGTAPHASREARAEGTAPRLGHVALAVRNLEQATAWYRDTLGFQLVKQVTVNTATSPLGVVARSLFGEDVESVRIAQLRLDHQVGLELFEFAHPAAPGRDPRRGYLHLCVITPDVEGTLRKALEHGGKLVVRGVPNVPRQVVFCQDPDGNVIEIASSPWDGM